MIKMQCTILIPTVNEADFLRATLPRTRRAMPDAKIIVITTEEDSETKSIAAALRVQCKTIPRSDLTKNDAEFNFSALVRAGQIAAKEESKVPFWFLLTRPHVVIDASISNLELSRLEADAVYGCATHEVLTVPELAKYQTTEPSSEEVRVLVPSEVFLLTHSNASLFPIWSKNTEDGLESFLSNFLSRYMIQKKLAHLGRYYRNARFSQRWGVIEQIRITPVHPNTQETASTKPTTEPSTDQVKLVEEKEEPKPEVKEEPKEEPKPEVTEPKEEPKPEEPKEEKKEIKKGFGVIDDEVQVNEGRKESEIQQHVPIQRGEVEDEVVYFKKTVRSNPWKSVALDAL